MTMTPKSPVPIPVPDRESDEPHVLAAWYFGKTTAFFEIYRKVIQAFCLELVRAEYATKGEKITETRLDALARLHPIYLGYITQHLQGRQLWEQAILERNGAHFGA